MELRHLRYFLAVAEEMNFTRAAEKLLIAQPPLSRQIRDLEEELEVPLFIREPHRLRLTEEGELFRQYAQQIIDLSEKSAEQVRMLHEGLHGTLYLGMVEGNAPYLISEWIAGFHRLHPRVQYDLWNGNSDEVTLRIRRGLCELALIIAPYNTEELEGTQVYEEPWVAIMSKDHPLAAKTEHGITLEQLAECDLLVPSRQSRREEIHGWFNRIGAAPNIVCRISNTINAFELAEQNVGVAIFPASQGNLSKVGHQSERESVCVREIAHPDIRARYVLVRAKNRVATRVAAEFTDYIEARTEPVTGAKDGV